VVTLAYEYMDPVVILTFLMTRFQLQKFYNDDEK
jgi:hypothetical protein